MAKIHETMARASARKPLTNIDEGLGIVRAVKLFGACIEAYCRIERLWVVNYHEMLTWENNEYDKVKQWIMTFAETRDYQSMNSQVSEIASCVLSILADRTLANSVNIADYRIT
jgi:hypothetical protein